MMRKQLAAFAVICALVAMPAAADAHGSLFVNLTTDESRRADMVMAFSKAMMERNHSLVVWFNDKAVFIASKERASKFVEQQKMLSALMGKGATVIACPMCMKHYGVKDADLIEGVKVGNPDLTGDLLVKEDTKILTWQEEAGVDTEPASIPESIMLSSQ